MQSKDAITRLKTLQEISASTLLDPQQLLVDSLAKCLASRAEDEIRSASLTVVNLYAGRQREILSKYLESIADTPRNLRIYIQQLQARFMRQREDFAADARSLCRAMDKFPRTSELSITLAGAVSPWIEFYEMLNNLDRAGILHFGVMQAACQSLSQPSRGSAAGELQALEEKLKAQKSENLRRLGLAALCGVGNSAAGWTCENLRKLRGYREDPSLMIASAAEFILPSAELVPDDSST